MRQLKLSLLREPLHIIVSDMFKLGSQTCMDNLSELNMKPSDLSSSKTCILCTRKEYSSKSVRTKEHDAPNCKLLLLIMMKLDTRMRLLRMRVQRRKQRVIN